MISCNAGETTPRAGGKIADSKSHAAQSGTDAQSHFRVPLDRLTTRISESELGFTTTRELPPPEGTIGQDRALRALESDLSIQAPGYSVFVTGMPGTGRNTTLASYLNHVAAAMPVPDD